MSHQPARPDALTDLERSVVEAVSTDEPWALVEEFSELERVSGTEDNDRRPSTSRTDSTSSASSTSGTTPSCTSASHATPR